MPELIINNFQGIQRFSDTLELERGAGNTFAFARNIARDRNGNIYVSTGYTHLVNNISVGHVLGNLFYSEVFQKFLVYEIDTGKLWIISELGVITSATGLTANKQVTYVDWPITGKVYLSDTVDLFSFNGTNLTALTQPLGAAKILWNHLDTLFAAQVTSQDQNTIFPSTQLDPTTFSSADAIKFNEGGTGITALGSFNGVLRVHKIGTIYEIYGSTFSGAAKDLSKRNLNTSRGSISQTAKWTEDKTEYFIAYDGLYKSIAEAIERIDFNIQGLINQTWIGPPTVGHSIVFAPTWGVEAGNKYIIFSWANAAGGIEHIFKYDIASGLWSEMTTPFTPFSFCFSNHLGRTCFLTGNNGWSIQKYENTASFDAFDPITGVIVTNPIDGPIAIAYLQAGGSRVRDKLWNWVFQHGIDSSKVNMYAGLDGIYPNIVLNQNIAGDSSFELPALTSHLLQLKFKRTGAGQPLSTGVSVLYEEDPTCESRNWQRSRKQSVDFCQQYGKIYDAGQVTIPIHATQVTINHGLNELPKAIVLSHQGYHIATNLYIINATTTQIIVGIQAGYDPLGTEKINWAVFFVGKRLYDAYIKAQRIFVANSPTVYTQYGNFECTPTVIFTTAWNAYDEASG